MPLTEKQRQFLGNCNHRWNIQTGATGSGKSWLDYACVIPMRLMHLRGEGAAVILGNTQGTVRRNILEPMRTIWGSDLVGKIGGDNAARLFGRRVYVLGADDTRHVARIQGMTIEYAYGDEVTTWSEDVFQMLKSRLRCPHSHFDGTCNPSTPLHWFKRFLDSDADIYCQTTTIFDNPNLPDAFVRSLCAEYEGTVYYQRFILGRWVAAEGAIYGMWDAKANTYTEDMAPPLYDRECRRIVSIDYGTANPMVFLEAFDDGTTFWIRREYYHDGRKAHHMKTDEEYADDFELFVGRDRRMQVILDPSALSFRMVLRNRGYRVKDADNSVLDGIRVTSTLIRRRRVRVLAENCPNFLREIHSYAWDEKGIQSGVERPLKEDDHAMDALRYLCKTLVNRRRLAA